MRVVITGAAGFVGRKLAERLARDGEISGEKIDEMALFDVVEPVVPQAAFPIEAVVGDISDSSEINRLIGKTTGHVFHLAAIVSGQAEAEFDTGMRINLDGTRVVLEACRQLEEPAKLIFSSSVAVFGGEVPPVIQDDTALNPQTSYGAQKAAGELLVNDYSRKGFVDGRSLRLPTVVVRPGKPNRAASTFASSIIREPLQGDSAVCPVDPDARMWIASPRTVLASLLHAHKLPAESYGMNRSITLPGITVSIGEMVEALERVAGREVVERISWEKDDTIARIVAGWCATFNPVRGLALGFPQDSSMDEIISAFIEDDMVRK